MKKSLFLLVFYFLNLPLMLAQDFSVSGNVVDENGEPLPGVNVVIKGTTEGTITDINGSYSLELPSSETTLSFSFVGFQQKDINVEGRSTINVALEPSVIGLDEVVAVGYGYKKRSVVTGSISSLNSEELMQSKPANINNALNGRAAGVTVMQSSGQPGSSPKVVIRGVGTNGNSDPLYIIDGVPMSDMNAVNPANIESMEVLKDATSTAIYGARGANGVILITTKKGESGKTTFSYDGFYGVQNSFNEPELLNSEEYVTLMKEFYANDGSEYPEAMPAEVQGVNTNWLDEITEPASVQEHNITATSGSDKGTVLFSLGYRDQNGIIGEEKSFFKRYTARTNATLNVTDFLTIGSNMSYIHINQNSVPTGTNGYNPVYYALQMDPTTPVYDENSSDNNGYGVSPVPFTRMWNPLAFMEVTGNGKNQSDRFYGNAFAEFEPIENLVFKSDVAVNISSNQSRSFSPEFVHNSSNYNTENSVGQSSNKSTFWQWENTVTYSKSFGGHNVTGLLGTTASQNTYEWLNGNRKNLPAEANGNENFWYLTSGDIGTATNGGDANAVHTLASVFGRLSYNYQEKYMGEVIVRRDGSSNFGPENKYAVFPGVSLGWNVSREDFFDVENFDNLKVRFSWGQNGNENIDPFSYTSVIANDRYYTLGTNMSVIAGSSPVSLVNPDVKWETSEQTNLGLDMAFYNNKLRASIDYYTKTTKDLLFRRTLEQVRGNEAPFYNVGEVKNSGIEIQIGYNFKVGAVDFALNGNASYLKNEVITVGNENGYEEGGLWNGVTNVTRMEEGMPIGYFYGYKIDGIFQSQQEINGYTDGDGNLTYPDATPGDFKWHDTDGDGQITEADRTDIGNPWPKWTYGLNLSAKWKDIDFSVFVNGKADVEVFSGQYRTEGYGRSNLPSFFMDRWTQSGDNSGVARLTLNDPNENFKKPSEFYVHNASFVKIGTIELGYTLPKQLLRSLNISKLRIYGAIDNAAIFTDYPMFDPEVGAMQGNILNTGIDFSMYPQARTSRIGVTLNF